MEILWKNSLSRKAVEIVRLFPPCPVEKKWRKINEKEGFPQFYLLLRILRIKRLVYVVFPKAAINARGSNTDKAVGLAVSAVPLSTGVDGLASEKWFDESEVVVPEG